MKKIICFALLLSCSAATVFAQYHRVIKRKEEEKYTTKVYARVGLGYAFQHAGATTNDVYGAPYSGSGDYSNTSSPVSYNIKKASLSTGFQGTIAGGYMINRHIGIELGINAGLSPHKYVYDGMNVPAGSYTANISVSTQAQLPICVMPALLLQTGGNKLNLYVRAGLALPVSTKVLIREQDAYIGTPPYVTNGSEVDDIDYTLKSGFAMGFTGAIGCSYKIGANANVWVEANMLSLSVYAKQLELTQYDINGQGVPLSQLSNTTTPYGFSGSNVSANSGTQPAQSIPYSNVGLMAGIGFTF